MPGKIKCHRWPPNWQIHGLRRTSRANRPSSGLDPAEHILHTLSSLRPAEYILLSRSFSQTLHVQAPFCWLLSSALFLNKSFPRFLNKQLFLLCIPLSGVISTSINQLALLRWETLWRPVILWVQLPSEGGWVHVENVGNKKKELNKEGSFIHFYFYVINYAHCHISFDKISGNLTTKLESLFLKQTQWNFIRMRRVSISLLFFTTDIAVELPINFIFLLQVCQFNAHHVVMQIEDTLFE